jgi:hypothetical protein
MKKHHFSRIILFITIFILSLSAQQIDISRITDMPNFPTPYLIRDWKKVTEGYDSLVFDLTKTGDYLPLVWIDGDGINYPNHNRFGLHTAVGNTGAEAINILPAVVGASLIGIDKSDQNGYNWVLMCEEFFNKRQEENVYLNNYVANSGNDWWYDTMPNVYFYMLYDLYLDIGDFDFQFTSVADRWLEAVKSMNGSTTPWTKPYMNYRAWDLSSMAPLESGVKEPEAAGAIGWILYNAFAETGEEKYRIGAEWCLEFLSNWATNPAYELQLPFGVYTAARMNAELGTDYNVEKLLNWCFTPDGNVREWGACLGNWGGYDCAGLIGEVKYDGYAFFMNGVDQFGALVPMVRYDDRFARTIGKWALNVANASRLFYTKFLSDSLQDSETWSHQYDPNSYIAHEALREFALYSGKSPYATGDFIKNDWGLTNLTLYGSSHVGMFGGIIDTTNIEGILKLDLLKTDFYQEQAYPSFLYYNPHSEEKNVEINVGAGNFDLYDAVENTVIKYGVSGIDIFTISSKEARILVLIPAESEVTYELDKAIVNGIVIDYLSGQPISNYPPRIKSLSTKYSKIEYGQHVKIYSTATDKDNDELNYIWIVEDDTLTEINPILNWIAPDSVGIYKIKSIVIDGEGAVVSDSIFMDVVESINHDPVIEKLEVSSQKIDLESETTITCVATDEDGDKLDYIWGIDAGEMIVSDSIITWTAPNTEGNYEIHCQVVDSSGATVVDSITIFVRDLTNQEDDPILYFPFDGNANDLSGYNNHGTVSGATLTEDRFGNLNSAYLFDGVNDYIIVGNNSILNFQNTISISFWMRIDEFFDTETFPISHGSYQNRWKLSIIPERYLRWTVKSTTATKDLDSSTKLEKDRYYHVATIYDGADFEIYINGELDAHTSFSGKILQTDIDLTIGQMLPLNNSYNFKGVLDDIRIYDYALSPQQIMNLYNENTNNIESKLNGIPQDYFLAQNFPNPFNPSTNIYYQIPQECFVKLEIYNILGEKICILVDEKKIPGKYQISWNTEGLASGIYLYKLQTRNFVDIKKCIKLK